MSDNKQIIDNESIVTPWKVEGNINYMKLVEKFGTELIDIKLIDRFEKITGKQAHPWLRRGIFFSHRSLNELLDMYEKGGNIFLYSGRGPSSSQSLHCGHIVPFQFTKWLQDAFDCYLVIQISDDEKYYFKDMHFDEIYQMGFKNARDIIAFGFNPDKTFIFSNRDFRMNKYGQNFEILVSDMKKHISGKTISKIFGFGDKVKTINDEEHYVYNESTSIGMLEWGLYQSGPAYYQAFPHLFKDKPAMCLVSYAIDQDPYFRLARDITQDMKQLLKPCSIMSTFLIPLTGNSSKMSSSINKDATIFLSDTPEEVNKKIMKYAFSGSKGDGSLKSHRELGGDPDTDVSYQYLTYFEEDDEKLLYIYDEFKSGRMTCSEIKKIMAEKLINMINEHQQRYNQVDDFVVKYFYSYNKPLTALVQKIYKQKGKLIGKKYADDVEKYILVKYIKQNISENVIYEINEMSVAHIDILINGDSSKLTIDELQNYVIEMVSNEYIEY